MTNGPVPVLRVAMLTEKEKHGIAEMLQRMETRDLDSLAATVTSRLIVPETSNEAVQAIILHTDRAVDLLKRRKVKKEFLFKYLHDKRVCIEATADKLLHVQRVLELWDSTDTCHTVEITDDDSGVHCPPPAPVPSRNASHTSLCSLDTSSRDVFNIINRTDSNTLNELRRAESSVSMANLDERSNSPIMFNSSQSQQSLPPPTSLPFLSQPFPAASSTSFPASSSPSVSQSQAQEMANNFVSWYFQLLNASATNGITEFSPSHFWPDASAKVELLRGDGAVDESLAVSNNAEEACQMLVGVMRRHQLQCNPNLCDEGVRGRLNPHGLVHVLACGTLHNQHTVCGIFEQVFGLVRDPNSDNNWLIKFTEARLVARSVSEQPSLANSSLCAIAYS